MTVLEVVAFVMFILFGLVGLCILSVFGYLGLYLWRHPHETDDKTEMIETINRKEGLSMGSQLSDETEAQDTYLGAMRIALEMIDMCDSYSELLQLLTDIDAILHGDRIEAVFTQSE